MAKMDSLLLSAILLLGIIVMPISIQIAKGLDHAIIPKVPSSSGIVIDGKIDEQAWAFSMRNIGMITDPKKVEFNSYLMHDGENLYMAIVILNNDYGNMDQISIAINDQDNPTTTPDSGTDLKFMYVNHTGKNYYDQWIYWDINQSQSRADLHEDGQGALTFSGARSIGVLGDYLFEFEIPLDSGDAEDAVLLEGNRFFMKTIFNDMGPPSEFGVSYGIGVPIFSEYNLPVDFILNSVEATEPQPEPTFKITANPSSQSISTSKTAIFNVTVPNFMSLSISGLPLGVTYDLGGPHSYGATDRFTVTIRAGDETPKGQHIITMTGSGGGKTISTTVQLNVESPPASSTSSTIRAIEIVTQFVDKNTKIMDIMITGQGETRIAKATVTDQSNHIIFSANATNMNGIKTPELKIEKSRFYFVTTVSISGETLSNVIYSSDHILENLPRNYWLGNSYATNYLEYLDIFERAYKILINLAINGEDNENKGVTINRVPWAAASGGCGSFKYGIDSQFEDPFIKEKQFLPNSQDTNGIWKTRVALDTRFHELAHAVLIDNTPSISLLTEEGIACFFEAELFRLLGYEKEYLEKVDSSIIYNFEEVVGQRYSTIASQFEKSDHHEGMGAWIVAYLLQDFVGYGEFEDEIDNPVYLVTDLGWDFLKNYFSHESETEAPAVYNNDEKLLYYFELASNLSLKQKFLDWGFKITSNYGTAPFYEYSLGFNVGNKQFQVVIATDSILSRVKFDQSKSQLSFRVTGPLGTAGFFNVTFPQEMLDTPYSTVINGEIYTEAITSSNSTHSALYCTYTHPEKDVQINGEPVFASPSPTAESPSEGQNTSPTPPQDSALNVLSDPFSLLLLTIVSTVSISVLLILRIYFKRKNRKNSSPLGDQ